MLLQALQVDVEMKDVNLQVTLLVQKGDPTPFPCIPTPLMLVLQVMLKTHY